MTKTKFNLRDYAFRYGFELLIRNHAFKNRKKITLTDDQKIELNKYYKSIKSGQKSFSKKDWRKIHSKIRKVLNCGWFDFLTYDLK